jgi:hypothetical protein
MQNSTAPTYGSGPAYNTALIQYCAAVTLFYLIMLVCEKTFFVCDTTTSQRLFASTTRAWMLMLGWILVLESWDVTGVILGVVFILWSSYIFDIAPDQVDQSSRENTVRPIVPSAQTSHVTATKESYV